MEKPAQAVEGGFIDTIKKTKTLQLALTRLTRHAFRKESERGMHDRETTRPPTTRPLARLKVQCMSLVMGPLRRNYVNWIWCPRSAKRHPWHNTR